MNIEVIEKQDQVVEPEEITGKEVGELQKKQYEEKVGTVATEEVKPSTDGDTGLQSSSEKESEGLSVEEIMSDEKPKTDIEKGKEGTPPWLQKRIDVITKEKNILKQENVRLKAESVAPKEIPKAPDRDTFDTVAQWQDAMAKWQEETNAFNTAQTFTQEEVEKAQVREQTNANRFVEQAEKLKVKFPDVYEIINKTVYGNAKDFIADSDHSVGIGLFLAKNPAELTKIANLTDAGSINRAIGKLEARFENVKPKMTNAPPSLNTIKGESQTVIQDIDDIKDDDEWYRKDKEQKLKKFKEN